MTRELRAELEGRLIVVTAQLRGVPPDDVSMADVRRHVCLADGPEGFLCSLHPTHPGDHEAWAITPFELMATWPR